MLATAAFAASLSDERWPAHRVGVLELKGLPDLVDVELELCPPPEQRPVEPVCGMAVARGSAAVTVLFVGDEIVLCSRDCLHRWAAARA